MPRSRHLERLQCIYTCLKAGACDINSLYQTLNTNDLKVLRRQIYRDIDSIKKSLLAKGERLVEIYVNDRKCEWKIVSTDIEPELRSEELYRLLITRDTLPSWIAGNPGSGLKEWFDLLIKTFTKQTPLSIQLMESGAHIKNTGFLQKKYSQSEFNVYRDIHWCIEQKTGIIINRILLDITCSSYSKNNFLFLPIKFIYHKGSVYVAGIVERKRTLVLDLCQISSYDISNRKYKNQNNLTILIEKELGRRFGLADNIDSKIYDIQIEVPSETGEYLGKFHWHQSQQFKLMLDGYLVRFRCGINKELLEWIFQLVENVRVVKPQLLKDLYQAELDRSKAVQNRVGRLKYSNVFIEK